jgi:hypothetical protein
MDFRCAVFTKDDAPVQLPAQLRAKPRRFRRGVRGGCIDAEVQVEGELLLLWTLLGWLTHRIVIYNPFGTPVWWGLIEDVSVARGALEDGVSIRGMYNRIQLFHTYEHFGAPASGITGWGENLDSIERWRIRKELKDTIEVDANPAMAQARRNTLLKKFGQPTSIVGAGFNEGPPYATLGCIGDFMTYGWLYYENNAGLEEHAAEEQADQVLGLGLTSNRIGFAKGSNKISDINGGLKDWPTGVRIQVSGSSSNNGAKTINGADSRLQFVRTGTGIAFDSNDDLKNDMGFVEVDDFIRVDGSDNNNATWRVTGMQDDNATVDPKTVQAGSSDSDTVITRGNYIKVAEPLVKEFPGPNVTLTAHGMKIAQAFRLASATSWAMAQVELKVGKVGNPTDQLRVNWKMDAGGAPGPVIATSVLGASQIGGQVGPERWPFGGTLMIHTGFTYWLEIERTGTNDKANYYLVEVDEAAGYTRGAMKLWTGAAWVDRVPNASLPFRILGAVEITEQIREIADATKQYVTRLDIRSTSGVRTNQHRKGDKLAYDEIVALLETGTSDGNLLFAEVSIEHILKVWADLGPIRDLTQANDGKFYDSHGRPLEPGVLPVGRWISRPDIPAGLSEQFRMTQRLLVEAEYDCERGQTRNVRWQDTPDPSDLLAG